MFLPRLFQSCLLQICCMWERDKKNNYFVNLEFPITVQSMTKYRILIGFPTWGKTEPPSVLRNNFFLAGSNSFDNLFTAWFMLHNDGAWGSCTLCL